jgi:predicted DNA-binding transcriptional regulator YafY
VRVARLMSIVFEIDSRPGITAGALAELLGVSVRTVYRDVNALQMSGVPVYGEVGRGGGLRLVDGYRSNASALRADEAAVLLAAVVPQVADQLGYGTTAARARRKVESQKGAMNHSGLTERQILIDPIGWYRSAQDAPYLSLLAEAMRVRRCVSIRYKRWAEPSEIRRLIKPHGLVMKAGTWYVVARSKQQQRTYRIDHILTARLSTKEFAPDPTFDLAAAWAEFVASFSERLHAFETDVALDRRTRDVLRGEANPAMLEALTRACGDGVDDDGVRVVSLPFESLEHGTAFVLRMGGGAEVLGPTELRERIARTAAAIMKGHRADPDRS